MEQLNRIELRGNVGSVRLQTFDGRQVANFSLATNFAYKNKDGVAVIDTTWHNITAWEGRNNQDLESIKSGDVLYVTGRVRTQKFTGSDGNEREVYEVIANRVQQVDEDSLSCEM